MKNSIATLGLSLYFITMILILFHGTDYANRTTTISTRIIKAKKQQTPSVLHPFHTPFILVIEEDSAMYKAHVPFEFWNAVDTTKYVFVMHETGFITNKLYRRSILDLGSTYTLFTLEGPNRTTNPEQHPTGSELPVGF